MAAARAGLWQKSTQSCMTIYTTYKIISLGNCSALVSTTDANFSINCPCFLISLYQPAGARGVHTCIAPHHVQNLVVLLAGALESLQQHGQ